MADVLTPDLCVIGGGAAGLAAARAALRYGASVVLIERDRLGGEHLHAGCVPARALAAAAEHAQAMRTASAFGLANEPPKVSFRGVHAHVRDVIASIEPTESAEHFAALGAEVIQGAARFLDKRTLEVGGQQVRARRFLIATGSRPTIPVIPGLEAVPFFTSETIFENTRKLSHLVIIGGGPTGIELAQAFRRLGADVSVLESTRVLHGNDPELVEIALRRLREEGVRIREETAVTAIRQRSMGIGVETTTGDAQETLDASHILVAAGRIPDLEGLDLERARVQRQREDPARLRLGPGFRTSNHRVYAIGDAAGGMQFTHSARRQGELAVRSMLLRERLGADAQAIPRSVGIDPELAEVGMSEAEATARLGGRFRVLRAPFSENDKARAGRATFGLAKMICDPSGRILGAGMVGHGAGELAALFSLAIASRLAAHHLRDFVAPYPSMAEIAARLGAEFFRESGPSAAVRRRLALGRLLP